MSLHLSKKSILKKTFVVGGLTLLSRILGIIREFLLVRFLGVGAISDAFIASFRLPNFFRLIFAEGALSASFVPVIVKTVKEGNREEANGLMTISFLFFEGLILFLYALVVFKTDWVLFVVAPGFSAKQVALAIPFLRILFSFLFFISSNALLAGALNAVNHFFVPAFGTPLWNMVYIASLLLSLAFKWPITYLCYGIIFGAFLQFIAHLYVFFKNGFTFGRIDASAIASFKSVLKKFPPFLFGVSIVELNFFISGMVASYLPKGDISLLYYGNRFMNIPLGMFAVALSSVLLAHFSRLVLYAPRRLSFYLLEAAKFVSWIIIPAMLFLMFVSQELFLFLLGGKATPTQMQQGAIILVLYASGLLFLCLNKILLSMFYALKDTKSTAIASAVCAVVNVSGDLISLKFWGAPGIAFANTISAITMTVLCFYFLYKRHQIMFLANRYMRFMTKYAMQLILGVLIFGLSFSFFVAQAGFAFEHGIGFWFVTGLLACFIMLLFFVTRHRFGVEVYFLKK